MEAKLCSDADCKAAGYVGFSQCGANPGQDKTCLCEPCTAADEKCALNTAYTCDAVTGKLTAQACGAGMQCKNAACVKPCTDECTQDACNAAGQVVACQVGVDGCKKKLAPAACGSTSVCLAGASGCGPCNTSSQCDANSVCAGTGKCVAASGYTYAIHFISAVVPTTDTTGSAWDGFGGAPDPYVSVVVSTVTVDKTTYENDTFTPAWDQTLLITLKTTDVLDLDVWDSDGWSDDPIDGLEFKSRLSVVKAGGSLSGPLYPGSTTSMTYTITPK